MDRSSSHLTSRIHGTWRMLSWKRALQETGEESDALGPDPFGAEWAGSFGTLTCVKAPGRPRARRSARAMAAPSRREGTSTAFAGLTASLVVRLANTCADPARPLSVRHRSGTAKLPASASGYLVQPNQTVGTILACLTVASEQ
jgi:hypothetical protein